MKDQEATKQLDTAVSLAKFLNVSPPAIRKWTYTSDMPRIKVGPRAIRFDRDVVLEWMQQRGK